MAAPHVNARRQEFYDDFANAAVVHGEAFDKILEIMIKREGGRYGVRAVSNRATKSMEATRGNFEHRLALTHLTWEVFNTLDVHIPNEYEYGVRLDDAGGCYGLRADSVVSSRSSHACPM